jgi:CheY-like chemotaxis protein
VHDTGIGIEAGDQKAIFSEFRRLESGMKHAAGLGLGLSIVDRIAKVLNHKVRMRSFPNRGTLFSVEIPVTAPALVGSGEPRSAAKHPGQKLEGLSVLSIDNDYSILEGMTLLLSQWGCDVHTAPDSETACATIAQSGRTPDIVLADYHLARETGIDAIHEIWTRFGNDIPCVLVTADRRPSLRTQAEREGIAILNKPVRPAGLRAVLSSGRVKRQAAE